ncbi:hypothetical protein ACIO6U_02705 [Streptomyces sp. NPDC087422]|uniref:hypothetical protein n=1 Tax=Streptomyces sp. NPDC087422 TaxID=3365786 RepID=UPI0037F35E8A
MPAADQQTPTAPEAVSPPLQQPLHPAHPEAPGQPVLVANLLDGTPTWIYPPQSAAAPASRVDPWAQRIMAAGAAAPLFGWGAAIAFDAMAGATTALGYLAACLVAAALLRAGSGGGGKVNIRIDNRH